MRNRQKVFWISLAGSITLLLLILLAVLSASSTRSLADTSPQSPAAVEAADSWTWSGPSHLISAGVAPMVKSLIIDPASPYTVYVGTNQGVYRSTNDGVTWQPGNGGLGGYGDLVVSAIDIDLTNHQRLVIGTWGYGLFRSVDGGLNWSRLIDPLASADLQPSAALDPGAPQVRVGGPSDTDPSAGSALLQQSLPSGQVIPQQQIAGAEQVASPRALPAELSWTPVRDVAIHPTNPSQIFACIDNGHGLFVSNNTGSSWSPVGSLPTASCRTFTFAPSNSQVRYASFGTWDDTAGFFRTTNGGVSWEQVGVGEIAGTVVAVAIHPTNSSIVLAGTSNDGLYRSENGGVSWTDVSTPSALPDVDFFSVAFAPNNPNVAYAGGDLEIYRSGDAGVTWGNADPAYPRDYVQGLAIHPTNSSTVLVGNNSFPFGGVYRRTNDLSAFALAASGMSDTFVLDIEQDPYDPNVLYAATWGAGVFRSENGGQTWIHCFGVPYVYTLEATEGSEGTILYAGTFYIDYGVLKSWDRGDTWYMVSLGWSSDISFDIKSLDGGPDNLVAATAHGVELSDDGGLTWDQSIGLDQGVVLSIAQSPFYANRLLAATYGGGVWSSTDTGASWNETSTGLGSQYVYDVAYSPNYNTAYAATLGVYRSDNGGVSWYPSGLSNTYIRALDTLGAPGFDVFAGTHNRGVYMAPQYTNWWLDLNDGLGEHRIRSIFARDYDTLFAGTNGRGAWEYTIVNRPRPELQLPLVLRNYGVASGFDSQFNGSAEGWVSHVGDWYYSSTVMWTDGIAGMSSSASYAEDFSNFEYEARVGRLGCDWCSNRLIVRGTPYPLTSSGNWYHEYMFQYSRQGTFSVYKRVAGGTAVALQYWADSPAIIQGGNFNVLKVIANGPNLYFYINGALVWSGTDYSLSSGRVGLGMYRDTDTTGNQFQADWARLTPLSPDAMIDDVVSAGQQALNDAANQRGGGSADQAPLTAGGTAAPIPELQLFPLQEQTEPKGSLSPSD